LSGKSGGNGIKPITDEDVWGKIPTNEDAKCAGYWICILTNGNEKSEKTWNGHMWIAIIDMNDRKNPVITQRGFYPAEGAELDQIGAAEPVTGQLRDEGKDKLTFRVAVCAQIAPGRKDTAKQRYEAALKELQTVEARPPQYSIAQRNCGDWAQEFFNKYSSEPITPVEKKTIAGGGKGSIDPITLPGEATTWFAGQKPKRGVVIDLR
jgi:hypothetical protein